MVVKEDEWIQFVKSLKKSLVQSKCSESVSYDEDDDIDGDGEGGSGNVDDGWIWYVPITIFMSPLEWCP